MEPAAVRSDIRTWPLPSLSVKIPATADSAGRHGSEPSARSTTWHWVQRHTDAKWVLLYVARWLEAPMRQPDGTLAARDRGTQYPQLSATRV